MSRLTILFALILYASALYYRNLDAQMCYTSVRQEFDSDFQECSKDRKCAQELKNYQMCSTSLNQTTQEEEIFNGYCFRQWWNEAVHTRKLIETLVENCLLTYNSLVSKKILLACTDYVLNQQYMPCEEACM